MRSPCGRTNPSLPSPDNGAPQGEDNQERKERHRLDRTRSREEPQRPPNVGGVSFASAISHKRIVDHRLAIDAWPRELEAERAGHRCFGPAGVRRAVTRRIAPYGARRVSGRSPWGEEGAQNEPQRGETRRRQIDEVVGPRRGPTERFVSFVPMADHAVGGINRLIQRATGKTAERDPKDRSDDAVGKILRQALNRRARGARFVQDVRTTTDDLGDRAAPLIETRLESFGHRFDVACEAALRRQARGGKGKRDKAERVKRDTEG